MPLPARRWRVAYKMLPMTPSSEPAARPALNIEHRAALQRFECSVDGYLCVADYRLEGGVMHMTHTGVHASLQGRGIAAALVAAALAHARSNALKIDPQCSYVRAYMQRHPDTLALLA